MVDRVWSRSRIDQVGGKTVVNPPVIDLAMLLAQDYERRRAAPRCLKCEGTVSRHLGKCTECGQPWIAPGKTCAYPRSRHQWRYANYVFWALIVLMFVSVMGTMIAWMFIYAE